MASPSSDTPVATPRCDPQPRGRWIGWLGRIGYLSKTVVFTVLAALNFAALAGWAGPADDAADALERVAQMWAGRALLAVLAVGLLLHGLWLMSDAVLDPTGRGRSAGARFRRAWMSLFGVVYLMLAEAAWSTSTGQTSRSARSVEGMTQWLVGEQPGAVAIALLAATILGVGIYRVQKGLRGSFLKHYRMQSTAGRSAARWIGGIGLTARGIWYGILAAALLLSIGSAAGRETVHEFVSRTLGTIAGPVALLLLAIGTLAYAAYCLMTCLLRDFQVGSARDARS
ncbi:MAG: DUF1206 domain-containing protein [Planctomycetota bacterium]